MGESRESTLTFPSNTSYLHMARAYVREVAELAGLADERTDALVLAADEACANVVQHAFEPGETGSITLTGRIDPSFAPRYVPPESHGIPAQRPRGLGFHFIGQSVDESTWIHRGPEGKELILTMHREQTDVTQELSDDELAPFRDDEPEAEPQDYIIRHLQEHEAIHVSRCIYRAYGYSYPNGDLYYPERVVRMNRTGELISAVAVTETGGIVGHYALERPDLGSVAESGQAVVVPAHRGRGLMLRMRRFLEEEARRLELFGVYGQPVTSHPFSQRVNERFGSKVVGLTLAILPRSLRFKRMRTEPLDQRESAMLYFRPLVARPLCRVYVPDHHREMVERIYDEVGLPAEFGTPRTFEGCGSATVRFLPSFRVGFIRIARAGADSSADMRRALRDLCDIGEAEAVFLELPLAQAATPDLCVEAEAAGFFFSGLGPGFLPDGDSLRLQYLNVPLGFSRLQIHNPFGRELLSYIAAECGRVSRSRS